MSPVEVVEEVVSVVEIDRENVVVQTEERVQTVEVGVEGPQGPPGPPGPGGGSAFQYVHEQLTPATVWTVNHGLNGYPNVTVVDSAGSVVMGDVEYLSATSVRLSFAAAFGGRAFLS